MKINFSRKVFLIFNVGFMSLLCLIMIAPFTHVLALSLTPRDIVSQNRMIFSPNPFHMEFDGYYFLFNGGGKIFFNSFINTVFVTVIGTVFEVFIVLLTAYPLSRKCLRYKNPFMLFLFIPMLVSPGIIPNYLIVQKTGLMGSLWSLIIPTLVSAFNVLLAVNFFKTLPESMEESALIDGAGHFTIAFKIVLPLSLPIVATICIYSSVGLWNTMFTALMYINDTSKYVLQVFVYQLVAASGVSTSVLSSGGSYKPPDEQAIMAAIVMTTVPIVLVYPFMQRYFIKGITIGAVKG